MNSADFYLSQWFMNLLSNQAWATLPLVAGRAWFDRRFNTHGLWTRLQVYDYELKTTMHIYIWKFPGPPPNIWTSFNAHSLGGPSEPDFLRNPEHLVLN